MSSNQKTTIARRFVEDVFNARMVDQAQNFLVPDIVYHGMGEEVEDIDSFKKWISEDLSAFPDMKITVVDGFSDNDKVALRWILRATHEKDFADFPATHKKFETQGVEILHFKGDKIKEAWTTCDLSVLAEA